MANTTNFGWETPDDTDLVKDGAAAMRTLGNSIDASFVDLKGGTTGQILSKNSNTDLDYVWINNDQGDITAVTAGTGISGGGTSGAVTITNSMATEITAAGDIIVGTGSGTFDNLPIGTTGQVLTADTTVNPYKVKWASPSVDTNGFVYITSSTFSNVASVSVDGCFTSTYETYMVTIHNFFAASTGDQPRLTLRYGTQDQTSDHYSSFWYHNPSNDAYYGSRSRNVGYFTIGRYSGASVYPSHGFFMIATIGTDTRPTIWGSLGNADTETAVSFGGINTAARTYAGFKLSSAASNISGTVKVYGLVKS